MSDFIDDVLGISDFIDSAGLWKLSVINSNLLTGAFSFFRLNLFWKVFAFVPFIVMLSLTFSLMIMCFVLALLSFIPFQLGRIGNACLNLALTLAGEEDGYNFLSSVFFAIIIYVICAVAILCLIVPKIMISSTDSN